MDNCLQQESAEGNCGKPVKFGQTRFDQAESTAVVVDRGIDHEGNVPRDRVQEKENLL
ncbi:hypothetical protein YTPLAS18_08010 [Nitrospira sp.]|nr:hypothetical protein YTPLAS18_08010 [Nitrospira sp.]